MKKFAGVLALMGCCALPAVADEPAVSVDPTVETTVCPEPIPFIGGPGEAGPNGSVDPVDPVLFICEGVGETVPGPLDPIGPVVTVCEGGREPLEVGHQGAEELAGHCHDLKCECPNPLLTPVPPEGAELSAMMFSTAIVDDRSAQPMMNARGAEMSAAGLERAAARSLNANVTPDAARGLLLDQSLRGSSQGVPSTAIGRTSAPTTQSPGLFGKLLVRNAAPAPVTTADRDYAQQLASIDQLRDRALQTGDAKLLEEAARRQRELQSPAEPRGLRFFRR